MSIQIKRFIFLFFFFHSYVSLAQIEISLILDVDPTSDVGLDAYGHRFISVGDLCYFSAEGANGREIWQTDGTVEGTFVPDDLITSNLREASTDDILYLNDEYYYLGSDSLTSTNIWKTDWSSEGTERLTDFVSGFVGGIPGQAGVNIPPPVLLTVYDDWVYFTASNTITVYQLWRTNGSTEGLEKVSDIYLGSANDLSKEMVVYDDLLYFWARGTSSTLDRQLWRTDGTEEGTLLVRDIVTQSEADTPEGLTQAGGNLYFAADEDGTTGNELWISDGTTEGTHLLKELTPGSAGSVIKYFTAFEDKVYFIANDKVWRTDGTEEGTIQIGDFYAETTAFSKNPFFIYDDKLFLSALNENNNLGRELYTINGDFITIFTEFISGEEGGSPRNFIIFDEQLIFNAKGEGIGQELWLTDGTTAGTVLLADIEEGYHNSRPQDFTIIGDILLFTAINSITGRDLYHYRDLTSDINESNLINSNLTVSPNPSLGNFTLKDIPTESAYCKIVNSGGQLVESFKIQNLRENDYQLSLINEPSGIYYFYLYDQENSFLIKGKLVKF